MKRSQRTATESPRPADVTTTGDQEGAAELPRFDDQPIEFDRVAQRAYERYEARGRQDGNDMEDWLEAERELRQAGTSSRNTGSDGRTDSSGPTARVNP